MEEFLRDQTLFVTLLVFDKIDMLRCGVMRMMLENEQEIQNSTEAQAIDDVSSDKATVLNQKRNYPLLQIFINECGDFGSQWIRKAKSIQ